MVKFLDSQKAKAETGGVLSSFQLLTLYFPVFVLSLGYSIATPAIPVFAKSFDTGFGLASLVIVLHGLGGLVAAVPTGFLVDRLGRRPMLLAGPLLAAASSCLTALARSFPELLVYRFFGGVAMEMWRQARLAIIADVAKSRERGRQMSGMQGLEGAGKLLGPALGGLLAGWSIRMPFLAHGALAFLAIVPSFFLITETAPRQPRTAADKKDRDALDTRALLKLMLDAQYRGFLTAQFFASLTRGVLWGGTLLLYVTYAYGVGPQLLGGLATTSSIIGIPITFLCGYLMDRFGRKTTMVPGFVFIALGLLFLASGAHWDWGLSAFVVGFFWIHGGGAITSGSMQVLGSDMAPARGRGRFFGFWRLIGEIGGLISPALFAFIAEQVAYSAAFTSFALFSLATAALLAFSVKETVGRGKL
ncbi:MAG TPA: MFS transporter [Candidatus Acidoferrales bacterium]|nr:MFS transporter [Candidatus Acidoferrales bacterium]